MTTGTDLVSGALRLISSLTPGEAIPGQEAGDALATLNMMLAGWSAESLMPPFRTLENFSIAAGIASRTIGSGAQLNTARPDRITDAYLRDSSNYDFPVDVTMTSGEHNAIALKSNTGRPKRLYYDPQYPNGTIYFDYTTDAAYTLYLESLKPVNQFTTLATTLDMPGEYAKAIKYLLADELSIEYGFTIQPGSRLEKLIEDSRDMIMRKNAKPILTTYDPALTGAPAFDINSG